MVKLRHMSERERRAFAHDPDTFVEALRFAARVADSSRFDTRTSAFTAIMMVVEEAKSVVVTG